VAQDVQFASSTAGSLLNGHTVTSSETGMSVSYVGE